MREVVGRFTRILDWEPAYNRVADGYGRHGMDARFVLKGELGAVHFLLFTSFYHSSDRDAYRRHGGILGSDGERHPFSRYDCAQPADLGYHSPKPQYENQSVVESCSYLDESPCYYGGSGLNAEDAFDVFTDEGEDALWKLLEQYYAATFEGGEFPEAIGRRWRSRLRADVDAQGAAT